MPNQERDSPDEVDGNVRAKGGQGSGARTSGSQTDGARTGSSGGSAQRDGKAGNGTGGGQAGGTAAGGSAAGGTAGALSSTSGGPSGPDTAKPNEVCGAADCCPDDPDKVVPGACGCGFPDKDSDSDGKLDCADTCPDDPNKVVEGQCGCDMPDTDTDGDGVADCKDVCPTDPEKATTMGTCGCGTPDLDSDGDGALDCADACPKTPELKVAGPCGCATATVRPCLAHRYSFNDAKGAITVADSVGTAVGTAVRVTLPGNGTVVLAGGESDQYIQLPSGVLSSLGDSVTVEAWARWDTQTGDWQRLFDFGNNDAAPGERGAGLTYWYLTPASNERVLRVAFATKGLSDEHRTDAPTKWPDAPGKFQHVAAVVDGTLDTLSLYLNGALQATSALNGMRLSNLKDVNNWLGRSQFAPDPGFGGAITELRIYSVARSASQVSASQVAGPDLLPAN